MGKPLQWHPAFQAVLQIEFADEAPYLQFLKEYNLADGPLRADTLIIKKEPGRCIQKKIGQIFRRFNIVEYKGPGESLSVRTYYQAAGYASILQARTDRENAVPPDEITLTLVGNRYPRKLFTFLKEFYGARIHCPYPGIYYVEGAAFPLQIVIQRELPGEENVWLSRLRRGLKIQGDVDVLARAYRGREQEPLYSAAMDLIIRANWKIYKEGKNVCDALNELFADKIQDSWNRGLQKGEQEGEAKGRALAILDLLEDMGQIPGSLRKNILGQTDMNILSQWLKAAAAAPSLEDFRKAAKL